MKTFQQNFYLCLLLIALSSGAMGQTEGVSIKTTASAPHGSAMLDVDCTTKGLLIPRVALTPTLTNSSPISTTPANGLLVYNTTNTTTVKEGFYYWYGGMWNLLSGLWSIDPIATPTTAVGIYRSGVVSIGQATSIATSSTSPTNTLQVFGTSIFYSQAISTPSLEYGIHISEPYNHRSIPGGHANEINCYREALDLQYNTKQEVSIGAMGGSNLMVGSGTVSPTDTTYGNIVADNDITAKGYMFSHNGIVLTSDSTLKKNIVSCTGVLTKLAGLNTYYYNYNTEPDGAQKHIGILAQQAERQYKQLVRGVKETTTDYSAVATGGKTAATKNTVTHKGVDYQGLTALLLQAIKEQQSQIDSLRTRVTALENK